MTKGWVEIPQIAGRDWLRLSKIELRIVWT
jgi:hypothetical protein